MEHIRIDLAAEAKSAREARRALLRLLDEVDAEAEWFDAAALAASEVITNAMVHAGAPYSLEAWAEPDGLRVEVHDSSAHLPVRRSYSVTSGTGRGLHILDKSVDRWGAETRPGGKTVWFELGAPVRGAQAAPGSPVEAPQPVTVTLCDVPLLMHWAWQEHAQALLREYLLFALDSDEGALDEHAQASDALSVLYDQLPVPELPSDPDGLLAATPAARMTAEEFILSMPPSAIEHFATLRSLLARACDAASHGHFLGPPTQPEIAEMRDWICEEVIDQAGIGRAPRPWRARTDVRIPLVKERELRQRYQDLSTSDEPILATDEASIIVAVTPPVVRFLGYDSESDLLGRRIIVVVPERFHQAHIAGTTLNATNGRSQLLDLAITVPVVRADGTEVPVELTVSPRRLDGETSVFVARFSLPVPTGTSA